jgi:hypothetical protein
VSYGYNGEHGSTSVMRAHSHDEIESLESDVSDLQRTVEELTEFRDEVQRTLGDFQELTDDVSEHGDAVTTISDQLKAIAARLAWLEGVVRAANLVPGETFAFDAEERALAATASQGRAARRSLLGEGAREAMRSLVTMVERASERNAEAVRSAAAAAASLAQTPRESAEHAAAAARYREARGIIEVSGQTVRNNADRAAQNQADLAADSAARTKAAPVIARGETAATALSTRLRTRLVDALGAHAMLPAWFSAVLGPQAPDGAPAVWFDAATALLVFRCTFGVTDPAEALGPHSLDDPEDRREARRRVSELLRRADPH